MITTNTDEKFGFETCRIRCSCHHPGHFIEFNYVPWEEFPGDVDVYFCADRIGGFWKRLWRALAYVFGSQELVTSDVCMSIEDAADLQEWLDKIQAVEADLRLKQSDKSSS